MRGVILRVRDIAERKQFVLSVEVLVRLWLSVV